MTKTLSVLFFLPLIATAKPLENRPGRNLAQVVDLVYSPKAHQDQTDFEKKFTQSCVLRVEFNSPYRGTRSWGLLLKKDFCDQVSEQLRSKSSASSLFVKREDTSNLSVGGEDEVISGFDGISLEDLKEIDPSSVYVEHLNPITLTDGIDEYSVESYKTVDSARTMNPRDEMLCYFDIKNNDGDILSLVSREQSQCMKFSNKAQQKSLVSLNANHFYGIYSRETLSKLKSSYKNSEDDSKPWFNYYLPH